jgi:hypothetical protein
VLLLLLGVGVSVISILGLSASFWEGCLTTYLTAGFFLNLVISWAFVYVLWNETELEGFSKSHIRSIFSQETALSFSQNVQDRLRSTTFEQAVLKLDNGNVNIPASCIDTSLAEVNDRLNSNLASSANPDGATVGKCFAVSVADTAACNAVVMGTATSKNDCTSTGNKICTYAVTVAESNQINRNNCEAAFFVREGSTANCVLADGAEWNGGVLEQGADVLNKQAVGAWTTSADFAEGITSTEGDQWDHCYNSAIKEDVLDLYTGIVVTLGCTALLLGLNCLFVMAVVGYDVSLKSLKTVVDVGVALVGIWLTITSLAVMLHTEPGFSAPVSIPGLGLGVLMTIVGLTLGLCLGHPEAALGGLARTLKGLATVIYVVFFVAMVGFAIGSIALVGDTRTIIQDDINLNPIASKTTDVTVLKIDTICSGECKALVKSGFVTGATPEARLATAKKADTKAEQCETLITYLAAGLNPDGSTDLGDGGDDAAKAADLVAKKASVSTVTGANAICEAGKYGTDTPIKGCRAIPGTTRCTSAPEYHTYQYIVESVEGAIDLLGWTYVFAAAYMAVAVVLTVHSNGAFGLSGAAGSSYGGSGAHAGKAEFSSYRP